MKIKTLNIHNIASVGQATIDFDGPELGGEQLFLISGDTGAGKSTILDCLCLALFNSTPRLSVSNSEKYTLAAEGGAAETDETLSVKDPRQLLRRGESQGGVELTFLGIDGKDYLAEWSVHRKNKKPNGPLQNSKWVITCVTSGETTSKVKMNQLVIERAVGMNAEQFYRTVILPQGQFDQFLKSSGSEKSSMLEQITGTEIYARAGKRIFEIWREKSQAVAAKRQLLEGIVLLDEEQKAALNVRLAQLKESVDELGKQADAAASAVKVLDDYTQARARLNDVQGKKQEVTSTLSSDEHRRRLADAIQWRATAEPRQWLAAADEAQRQCRVLTAQKSALLAEAERLLAGNAYLDHLLSELKQQQEQHGHPDDYQKKLDELEAQYQACGVTEKKKRKELLNEQRLLLQQARDELKRRQDYDDAARAARSDADAAQRAARDANAEIDPLARQCGAAQDAYQLAKTEFEHRHTSLEQWAKRARQELRSGDTCPVCGQVVDRVLGEEMFEHLVGPFETAMNQAHDRWVEAQAKHKAATDIARKLDAEAEKAAKKALAAAKNLATQESVARQALVKCGLQPAEDIEEQISAKVHQVNEENQEIATQLERADDLLALMKQVRSQMNRAQQLQDQIIRVNGELQYAELPKQSVMQIIDKEEITILNRNKVERLAERWSQLSHKWTEWHSRLESQQRLFDDYNSRVEHFIAENDCSRERLLQLMAMTVTSIESIEQRHESLTSHLARLEGEQKQIEQLLTDLLSRREKLGERPREFFEQRQAEITQAIAAANQEAGALSQQLENDREQARRVAAEAARLAALKADADEWAAFSDMLGSANGNKFRNIAQSFILNDLLRRANHYLMHFDDRYELYCQPGTLTVLVRDLQCGNRTSSVYQLSGGESFMVSLSLALALASMTGHVFAVDTLFIDEGFGSLSAPCLDKVMETLGRLNDMGGRRVGIISHVESLKERVPVQIVVRRDPDDRTRSNIFIQS